MPHKFSENESLDNLNTVDDNLRSYYEQVEEGAKFTIRPELRGAAGAWDRVNDVNHKLRKESKVLQSSAVDLSPLAEYGTSTEEILTTINSRFEEMSNTIESKKGAVDPTKIRNQMTAAHKEQMEAKDIEFKAVESQMHELLISSVANAEIAINKGNPKFLLPDVFASTQIVKVKKVVGGVETIKLEARVMDADGQPRIGPSGDDMTIGELIQSYKKDPNYAAVFESDARSGGGVAANRTPLSAVSKAEKSSVDKIAVGIDKIDSGGSL